MPLEGDTEVKGDYMGLEILPEEWYEPHIRYPIPGVWHQEDESPRLIWKPVGPTGGL